MECTVRCSYASHLGRDHSDPQVPHCDWTGVSQEVLANFSYLLLAERPRELCPKEILGLTIHVCECQRERETELKLELSRSQRSILGTKGAEKSRATAQARKTKNGFPVIPAGIHGNFSLFRGKFPFPSTSSGFL